jgi:hypothetical protein
MTMRHSIIQRYKYGLLVRAIVVLAIIVVWYGAYLSFVYLDPLVSALVFIGTGILTVCALILFFQQDLKNL